jgi:hypothetical protein
MIQENELRIGNLVNYENEAYCVWSEIRKYSVTLDNLKTRHIGAAAYDEIEPIPQTEEWLLKFGFEKTNIKMSGCNVWQKGKYRVLKSYLNDDNSYSLCIDGITPPTWAIAKFEYVHQFQNIYFALEKQELEIKK